MIIDTETCTEEQAHYAYRALTERFGWAGVFLCRADVEDVLAVEQRLTTGEAHSDLTLTNDQWTRLTGGEWRTLAETMVEDIWPVAMEIICDFGLDEGILR